MVEDLMNHPVFRAYPEWLQACGANWEGPLGPSLAPKSIRLAQRMSEAQLVGAHSEKSAIGTVWT